MKRLLAIAGLVFCLLGSQQAHAACASPTGAEGDVVFNSDFNALQYCDGTDWRAFKGATVSPPSNGLVAYWPMDDGSGTTATDSSGNGNDASLVGPTWITGQVSGGLAFSGGDYVDASSPLGTDTYDEFTFAAWYKSDVASPVDEHGIFYLEDNVLNLSVTNDAGNVGHLRLELVGAVKYYGSTDVAGDQSWHHIVVVRTATNIIMYVDGVEDLNTSDSSSGTTIDPVNDSFFLGYNATEAVDALEGSLDEAFYYNRALSATEVQTLYQYGGGSLGSSGDITTNLVGHWKLDETSGTTIADSAGSNTGTWNGSAGVSSVAGQLGTALTFDGTDDYIEIANESNFDFERTDPFTIAAWVYRNSNSPEDDIFAKYTTGWKGYGLFLPTASAPECGGASGCVYLGLLNTNNTNHLAVYSTDNLLSATTWHHVVATYDGSSTPSGIKIYVDGVEASTATQWNNLSASILNNSAPVIGYDPESPGCCEFGGRIDDVRVYSRELTAADVGALYAATVCTGPAGDPGDMLYNADEDVLQWCADGSWRAAGPVPGTGGAGCSSPTGARGDIIYNADYKVPQYCDGTYWRAAGEVQQPSSCASTPASPPAANNNVQTVADYTAPFSYTVGAGSDRLLTVAVLLEGSATYSTSAVSFDGNAMTKAADVNQGAGWSDNLSLWYLPVDGVLGTGNHTGNISITHSGSPIVKMVAVDYITNADQDAPVSESQTAANSGTSINVSYTVADNTLTLDAFAHQLNENAVAGNGQTEIAEVFSTAETATLALGYKTHATGSTPTLGWSQASSGREVLVSSEIKACQ